MEFLDIILLLIFGIVGILVLIKFIKWGIKSFSNDKIMENFGFKEIFFPLLLLFWIILITTGLYKIIFYKDKIFSQEILNAFSEININVDALIKNLPILIIMLLVILFIIFVIPIICLLYYHKHKKNLKKQHITDFKKIARTHFLMGLTSPIMFPLFLGLKFLIGLLPTNNGNKKRFSTYYTKVTDSKGNTTYVDTIIDNETGYGSTKVEDSKGNKSYHTTFKD